MARVSRSAGSPAVSAFTTASPPMRSTSPFAIRLDGGRGPVPISNTRNFTEELPQLSASTIMEGVLLSEGGRIEHPGFGLGLQRAARRPVAGGTAGDRAPTARRGRRSRQGLGTTVKPLPVDGSQDEPFARRARGENMRRQSARAHGLDWMTRCVILVADRGIEPRRRTPLEKFSPAGGHRLC